MTQYVIPTIGSSGYFELRPPLDTLIIINERYTCQGLRKLSEYLANNEDPKTLFYNEYSLTQDDYDADILEDMVIASLQSEIGHWLYIPVRYIVNYPITNGIPYRTVMIGVSLPSLPVERDLTYLQTDIENLITDSLGVTPVIKIVETSRVVLVPRDKHDITQSNRTLLSNGRTTDRSRYASLLIDHQNALDKIGALERYIHDHYTP
jgi:hypothetical protein